MSVISEINHMNLHDVSTQQVDNVRREIARRFWSWYRIHRDDVVIKRKVAFWTLTVRVNDLHFLFTEIFGPETVA